MKPQLILKLCKCMREQYENDGIVNVNHGNQQKKSSGGVL